MPGSAAAPGSRGGGRGAAPRPAGSHACNPGGHAIGKTRPQQGPLSVSRSRLRGRRRRARKEPGRPPFHPTRRLGHLAGRQHTLRCGFTETLVLRTGREVARALWKGPRHRISPLACEQLSCTGVWRISWRRAGRGAGAAQYGNRGAQPVHGLAPPSAACRLPTASPRGPVETRKAAAHQDKPPGRLPREMALRKSPAGQ